jgi:hypothetical protein
MANTCTLGNPPKGNKAIGPFLPRNDPQTANTCALAQMATSCTLGIPYFKSSHFYNEMTPRRQIHARWPRWQIHAHWGFLVSNTSTGFDHPLFTKPLLQVSSSAGLFKLGFCNCFYDQSQSNRPSWFVLCGLCVTEFDPETKRAHRKSSKFT